MLNIKQTKILELVQEELNILLNKKIVYIGNKFLQKCFNDLGHLPQYEYV